MAGVLVVGMEKEKGKEDTQRKKGKPTKIPVVCTTLYITLVFLCNGGVER